MSDDRVERALAEIAGDDGALNVERVHARAQQRRRRSIARRSGAGVTAVALAVGGWAVLRDDDPTDGPDLEVIDEPQELSDQLAVARSTGGFEIIDAESAALIRQPRQHLGGPAAREIVTGSDGDAFWVRRESGDEPCPPSGHLELVKQGEGTKTIDVQGRGLVISPDGGSLAIGRSQCASFGYALIAPDGSVAADVSGGSEFESLRPIAWSSDSLRLAIAVRLANEDVERAAWSAPAESWSELSFESALPRDGEYSTDVDGNLFAVANTSEMGLSLLELDNETFEVTDTLVELPPGIAGDLSVDASGTKFAIVIVDAEAHSALYTWQRGDTEVRKLLDEVESAAWLPVGAPAPAPTTTTEPTTSTPRTSPERPLFAVREDGMLVEMSVDGSIVRESRLLPTDLYSLAVTPDRKTAYYTQDGDGCANAFSLSLATADAEPEFLGLARQLELSDDGRFLALSRYSPGGAAEQQCTDVPPVAWAVEVQDRETDSSVYFEEPNVDGSVYPASAGHLSFDPSGQFLAVEVCFEGCHVAVLIHFNGGLELLEAPTFERLGQLPVFVDQSQVYVYECTCFEDVGDAEIVRRATDHWNDDGRFANLNDPLDDGAMIGDHVPIAMSVVSATPGDDRLFVLFDDGRLVAFGPDGRGTVLDGGYVAITSQGQVTDE